jgi:RNA polymerase sigma-70 factor, ECF subfamily
MDEDLKLVKAVLNGNIDSFNILVNKYEMFILKFIYNMLRDREASEDITQEVFITVYNKLYMYNSNYKFSNWVLQIAKNKCIDYMRKYKRVYEANVEDVKELATKEMSPEESAEFKETKSQVLGFISELSEIDRQIVLLKYTQDVTFAEMSQLLEMNESAIKRRYYKARDNFKEYLKHKEKRCRI